MQNTIIKKIVSWLHPSVRLDKDILNIQADITFLNNKIRLSRMMFSDVLANKLRIQRDKLEKKHERLVAKRRLFK